MKLFTKIALLFLVSWGSLFAQQNHFGALETPNNWIAANQFLSTGNLMAENNFVYYVGNSMFPTPQSAVNFACAVTGVNAKVVVPPSVATGVNLALLTGCTHVFLQDDRAAVPQYCTWGSGIYTCASGGGGGGGNPSVGTQGQMQIVGATTGLFAAGAITDTGSELDASEPLVVTIASGGASFGSLSGNKATGVGLTIQNTGNDQFSIYVGGADFAPNSISFFDNTHTSDLMFGFVDGKTSVGSNQVLGWASTANDPTTLDTGFSRTAADAVACGNSTFGDASCAFSAATFNGVPLSSTGSATLFLTKAGTYVALSASGVVSLTGDSVLFSNSVSTGVVTLAPRTAAQNSGLFGPASGGTGAFSFRSMANADLPTETANTLLGSLTATTPTGLPVPTCSTTSSGLIWTTGTGFGCTTNFVNTTQTQTLTNKTLTSPTLTSPTITGTLALPNGATATTQAVADNTTKVATDAFVLANAGSVSGGTANYLVKYGTGGSGTAVSLCDEGVTTANTFTCADTAGASFLGVVKIAGTAGVAGGATSLEGTALTGVTSSDILEAVSAQHRWEMNNNNAGIQVVVGTPVTPITAGHVLVAATNGWDQADGGVLSGSTTNFNIPRDANAHYEVANPGSSSFSTVSFNNASGAGTYTAVGAPNTGTGYVSMQTTTTATINTATGIASLRDILPINNPTFQAVFYLSATTNVNVWVGLCGFCNVSNATHTDLGSSGVSAAGFRYVAGTDTTWACYASGTASAAGTSSATGVTPSTTTMQKFDVIYVAGAPTYYINNTRVCSGFAPTVLPDPTAIAGGQVVWDNTTAVAITGNIFDLYYGAN